MLEIERIIENFSGSIQIMRVLRAKYDALKSVYATGKA